MAFVLDTTGSMGGLIEGAKQRIWSVARRIGEGRPRPDLRIALVAYRDKGDLYVTQVHDFTGDMDAVYARLMSFQADGGGDTPEHVSAALHDSVERLQWSRSAGLKVVFLVGDAPPHLDYQDGFDYRRAVASARQKGIAVETIQCGGDPQTARVWQEIAGLGGGHYAQIDASGGMPAQVTPVDADLARLNRELISTVVAGGTVQERAKTGEVLAARAAMARRGGGGSCVLLLEGGVPRQPRPRCPARAGAARAGEGPRRASGRAPRAAGKVRRGGRRPPQGEEGPPREAAEGDRRAAEEARRLPGRRERARPTPSTRRWCSRSRTGRRRRA